MDVKKRTETAVAAAAEEGARVADASARKRRKPRHSACDKSEFVSVEVGMRELKRRLEAAPEDVVEAVAADATFDSVANAALATRVQRATREDRGPVYKKSRRVKTKTVLVKSAVPMDRETNGVTCRADEDGADAVVSKMTLAEVKQELKREQRERVETRVQALQQRAETKAADSSSTPRARIDRSRGCLQQVRGSGGKPLVDGNQVMEATAASMFVMPENNAIHAVSTCLAGTATCLMPIEAGAVSSVEPLCEDEFIAEDMDEDAVFAMALEEVEKKLTTSQTSPPPCTKAVSSTDLKSVAPHSLQVPTASPISVQSAIIEPQVQQQRQPEQVLGATQQQATEAMQIEATPEILKEMEHLRRENEFLRRSNELLRAAALTSPLPQANDVGNEQPRASPDHMYSQNVLDSLREDTSPGTVPRSSTTRFLNLTRCDNEQDMEPMVPSWETHCIQEQVHATNARLPVRETSPSNAQGKDTMLNLSNEDTNSIRGRRMVKDEKICEPGISAEHKSKLPGRASSQHLAAATGPSTAMEDGRLSATEFASDQGNGTAQLTRSQSREMSSSAETAHGRCAQATTGSGGVDERDVSMLNVDERDSRIGGDDRDEEEQEVNGDRSTERESTVDCGSHAEYKVRREYDYDTAHAADKHTDEVRDLKPCALADKIDTAHASATHAGSDLSDAVRNDMPQYAYKRHAPAHTEHLERATAPHNADSEGGSVEDTVTCMESMDHREGVASAPVLSEGESETESDEDMKNDNDGSNVLEAALKAAGGDSDHRDRAQPRSVSRDRQFVPKNCRSVAALDSLPLLPANSSAKKLKSTSTSSVSTKKLPSTTGSLLWPALDDFYDFLLDMSPRNIRGCSEQKRVHLKKYAGKKLPAQHNSVEDYCSLQLEAVMEELMASVSNATNTRASGRSSLARHLSLTSVSSCDSQRGSAAMNGLSVAAIFSESGYTGTTSCSDDFVLTFDLPAHGKKNASDFTSGDLLLVRSPRWKTYNMCVFGVVLCISAGSVGGKGGASGSDCRGSRKGDKMCVLMRAHARDQGETGDTFSVLTELCLSNQRAPNWRWSLEQVHNITTSAREYQAIRTIPFFSKDLQQLLLRGRVEVPTAEPTSDNNAAASSSVLSPRLRKYLLEHYNDSQVQAIVGCLRDNSRVIVQGPPGTGKSKTVLGLLSALLDGGGLPSVGKAKGTARIRVGASLESAQKSAMPKTGAATSIRILVAAPSNGAVDELVVRVLCEGLFDSEKGEYFHPRIVRVGRPESDQQLSSVAAAARERSDDKANGKKKRKYAHAVEQVLLDTLVTKHRSSFSTVKQTRQAVIKNAQIVFCTLSGAGSAAMCEFAQDFDALVIDEAAQAVEASTLIPFKFRPRRVVLVGDHRQLPATVISKQLVSMGYDRSLQQRLVENNSPVLLLSQQYRMHPEVAEFPSAYFYSRRLVQDDNMREWTAQDYHSDSAFKPLLFYDVHGAQSQVTGSTSLRNLNEVEVVTQLVRRLLDRFPHKEWKNRIGVIAPYKQQIHEVRGAIGKLEAAFDCRLDIDVNTVDGFQGREKEIIIYSCVRTSYGGRRPKKRRRHKNGTDDNVLDAFWADERRMNVAITRAKSSLWIVGNSTLLKQSRAWKALIQHTKDHDRYIRNTAAFLASTGRDSKK
ncbi:unnamed protein product [Hyaloperonospora brassicae]|uniref:AAA+ ATPase domain-containing protein n=1 Tax=Hyaloperonospora brassicae TaxID=162125 RepID=A0AAV0UGS7_HYABA|nr:unnamed protein product [Hyaloperonospora brassicae]